MPVRPAHPTIGGSILGSLLILFHVNRTQGVLKLIHHDYVVCTLNNLKREGLIVGTRNPWPIALQLRVARLMAPVITGAIYDYSFFGVVLLLRQRFGLVRDLTALHNPLSSRPSSVRAHDVGTRSRLRIVILNADIGGHKRLPDSVEVGFAISRTGRLIGRKLTRGGHLRGG